MAMDIFKLRLKNFNIEYEVKTPFYGYTKELACLILESHKIPRYLQRDIKYAVDDFIASANKRVKDEIVLQSPDCAPQCSISTEDVIKKWENVIRSEISEFGEKFCATDEEIFAAAYHKMVHSPALEQLLNQEHQYAEIVRDKIDQTDASISEMSNTQTDQMNMAVEQLGNEQEGIHVTEETINDLASRHFEQQSSLRIRHSSEIDTIKEAQRREYRSSLMRMVEQSQTHSSEMNLSSPLSELLPALSTEDRQERMLVVKCSTDKRPSEVMEESFTIHLGSQLKQMHNIRVISANIHDFCEANLGKESVSPKPEKQQAALNLYSNDLSAIVLMTDTEIGSRLNQPFRDICQRSVDFHFPPIDAQLDLCAQFARDCRKSPLSKAGSTTATNGSSADGSPTVTAMKNDSNRSRRFLQPGDCYVTRHANLAQAHVVFHMVADENALRGVDINSRHPVVLGLRNVLKAACANDVTTITVPLLLNYDMGEEMTLAWCEKRAELIYKCVKGFMIEMASWGGSELKNLQFMLPPGISWNAFQQLTDMLPRIFKLSNPLILKTNKLA